MNLQRNPKMKSGLAAVSFVLGLFFFIPFVGAMTGLIAIILGVISLTLPQPVEKKTFLLALGGVGLGLAGIIFTLTMLTLI